jgi:hypothetical protein
MRPLAKPLKLVLGPHHGLLLLNTGNHFAAASGGGAEVFGAGLRLTGSELTSQPYPVLFLCSGQLKYKKENNRVAGKAQTVYTIIFLVSI